jgi:uncharacterized damage-inducible protein DinB
MVTSSSSPEGLPAGPDSIVAHELLASWERQTRILTNLFGLIGEEERGLKASVDGWPVVEHLAHIHEVRYGWLSKASKPHAAELGEVFEQHGEEWKPIADLDEIKRQLALSAAAVGNAVRELIAAGAGRVGPYSHPVHFLQHMIWHEGYHFAILTLALRLAGKEPGGEWEEENVWGVWRS